MFKKINLKKFNDKKSCDNDKTNKTINGDVGILDVDELKKIKDKYKKKTNKKTTKSKKRKNKKHFIEEPRNWNNRIKYLLQGIGYKSMGYRWLHSNEADFYEKRERYLAYFEMVVSVIIATMSSATILALLIDTGLKENINAQIALYGIEVALSIIVGVIAGYRQIADDTHRVVDHQHAADHFAEIYHEIQEQFSYKPEHRDEATGFLKYKRREYDNTVLNAPQIRKKAETEYSNLVEQYGLGISVNLQDVGEIEIYEDAIETDEENNEDSTTNKNKKKNRKVVYEANRFLRNF